MNLQELLGGRKNKLADPRVARIRMYLNNLAVFFIVAMIWLALTIATDTFGTVNNITNVLRQSSLWSIIAIGQTVVLITAGIDLSIGSVVGLTSCIVALMLNKGYPISVSVIFTMLCGLGVGAIHALGITKGRLPPFIMTLAGLTGWFGVALLITGAMQIGNLPADFKEFSRGDFIGIPNLFWCVIGIMVPTYIILNHTPLGNHLYAILHLGMSGSLHIPSKKNITNLSFYSNPTLPKKHNHIIIDFEKIKLIYNDPRRFGYFKILKNKNDFDNYFTRIGPEALDKKFNLIYLKKKIKNRKKNIKNLLLDQKIVSGIGNIYANEILYKSKISPMKSVRKLSSTDLIKIIKFSRITLKNAIKFGGSSIKDFKDISGGGGNFQTKFTVYNRENQKCAESKCKGIIQKRYISNRSTFICNFCQK